MVHEILWQMHGARNGERFTQGLRMLKEIVGKLSRDGPFPFIGRIITTSKFYAGRLEELKLINNQLKFRVRGCHSDGQTNGTAGVFEEVVKLEDLKDIQIVAEIVADGKIHPVFFSNLFPDIFNKNGEQR